VLNDEENTKGTTEVSALRSSLHELECFHWQPCAKGFLASRGSTSPPFVPFFSLLPGHVLSLQQFDPVVIIAD
jgi:hypothetical protein